MARRIQEEDLQAIEEAVRLHPEGMTEQQIADALESAPPRRTLQYCLKSLVDGKRLVMESAGRWARYRVPRNGTPVAGLRPLPPRQFVPRAAIVDAGRRRHTPRVDWERLRSDLDALVDPFADA